MLYNFTRTDNTSYPEVDSTEDFFSRIQAKVLKLEELSSINLSTKNVFNHYSVDTLQEEINNIGTERISKLNSLQISNKKIRFQTSTSTTQSLAEENAIVKKQIQAKFENELIFYLEKNDIELGNFTDADKLLNEYLDTFDDIARIMLNTIFLSLLKKIDILCAFLILLSRQNPSKIGDIGHTIASAALGHNNSEVRENAIRIFENFSDTISLEILVTSKNDIDWIQDYKEEVILDIQDKLAKL